MTDTEDTLARLISAPEQRQIVLRAVLLDLVRIHACCACPDCRWALDHTIIHARLAGAGRADIKDAYTQGRKEQC